MKWFPVLVLWLGAELAEGGALRCAPDNESCEGKVVRRETAVDMKSESSRETKPVVEMDGGNKSKANIKLEKVDVDHSPSETQARLDTKFDDTEHPDVEAEIRNDRESLEHSFEELDYNIYENDLNHVHTIQDQDNQLEELEGQGKDERHRLLKRSVCSAGAVVQRDCNTCSCAPGGQSYVCTHNECMEGEQNKEVEILWSGGDSDHIERHTVCAARGTFYIGCNTCHCNALGTDYSCSNKPCPLPEDVELFHELKDMKPIIPYTNDHASKGNTQQKTVKSSTSRSRQVCVANRMFIKDCNTCWCNDDGTSFVCTRKVCVPELPEPGADHKPEELRVIKKECRPDEVFEVDCNVCRCNPDGKSFSCTRRACVDPVVDPVVHPVDELLVDPVDFSTKNASLLRKARGTQDVWKACQPDSEFRMDCNTCLCTSDGQDFSCTRKDCSAVAFNGAGARAKRESTDFHCTPGEVVKRGCLDCHCSADGFEVHCPVRLCDENISPPSQ